MKRSHPRQNAFDFWPLYFDDSEELVDGDPLSRILDSVVRCFKEVLPDTVHKFRRSPSLTVFVDYQRLCDKEWLAPLCTLLRHEPVRALKCIAVGFSQAVWNATMLEEFSQQQQQQQNATGKTAAASSGMAPQPVLNENHKLQVRVCHYGPPIGMKDMRTALLDKFVSLRGTIARVSTFKLVATHLHFSCNACGESQTLIVEDNVYQLPRRCTNKVEECKAKTFTAQRSKNFTRTVNWQRIKIQEKLNLIGGSGSDGSEAAAAGTNSTALATASSEAGRIPRTLEIELKGDLVDTVVPGDVVAINGIVRLAQSEEAVKQSSVFNLYIEANSLSKIQSLGGERRSAGDEEEVTTKDGLSFTLLDLYAVRQIAGEENLFSLIVNSLCPSIFGHEIVKAGLLLALFGGRQRYLEAAHASSVGIRGDPHVIVVGDPGLGKSQMLTATANLAPRGVYVSGNTTSSSGLTVTLSRESGSEYALEAGALVLADQGCCCIDEFDKMTEYASLLEAMEQQSISIAKAGVVATLPARTSIIAAANPAGGHYNKAKSVSENLKMDSALLSRFDLIFILLDRPDQHMDRLLSENIVRAHVSARELTSEDILSGVKERSASAANNGGDEAEAQTLEQRLRVLDLKEFEPIPHDLLRKYIAYARKYCQPRLSPGAAAILRDFYLKLRSKHRSPDSTPITTRQLESLVRLAEARARMELRAVATEEDAEDVIDIMKSSLLQAYMDESDAIDFGRSQLGTGMSKRGEVKKFVAELARIVDRTCNTLFTQQQLFDLAREMNLQIGNFGDFIETLNQQSYLIKRPNRVFKFCC